MKKAMKVILLKNVPNLGQEGDVKEVALGYVRNFLIPRGLAEEATPEKIKAAEEKKAKKVQTAELDLAKAQELASKFNGQVIEVSARASEEGRLYAALPLAKIVAALKAKGLEVSKDSIKSSHIKEIGEHLVKIELEHNLEAAITLIINPEVK